jgi:hypothetical protein
MSKTRTRILDPQPMPSSVRRKINRAWARAPELHQRVMLARLFQRVRFPTTFAPSTSEPRAVTAIVCDENPDMSPEEHEASFQAWQARKRGQ